MPDAAAPRVGGTASRVVAVLAAALAGGALLAPAAVLLVPAEARADAKAEAGR